MQFSRVFPIGIRNRKEMQHAMVLIDMYTLILVFPITFLWGLRFLCCLLHFSTRFCNWMLFVCSDMFRFSPKPDYWFDISVRFSNRSLCGFCLWNIVGRKRKCSCNVFVLEIQLLCFKKESNQNELYKVKIECFLI